MGFCNAKCKSTARLDGKTAVITGSNTGIGKMTAMDFYRRGAHVVMACRTPEKGMASLEDIKEMCKKDTNLGKIELVELNLCSFFSIRKCAKTLMDKFQRIDLLVNNAGIMACPYSKTEDGFEMQFGTNHLGHFLFTLLLLPKIIKSAPARIVNVSSLAHRNGKMDFEDINWEKKAYKSMAAYGQSKLSNILFAKELSRRLEEANVHDVTVYSLHPGVIATELDRHFDETYFRGLTWMWSTTAKAFMKTPMEGAQTTIYCSVDEEAGKQTGLYYSDCKVAETSKDGKKMDDAKRLWDVSFEMVGLDKHYNPFEMQT